MYSVFLVEDEIVIREGVKNLISWEEYGFIFYGEAPDGELAWPAIKNLKPDIVITDIKMPFMDGLELSKLIRKELPDTTIVVLSGYDDFYYAQQAIQIGINQYLLKPLSKSQLVDVLLEIKRKKDDQTVMEKYNEQFNQDVEAYLSSSQRAFFEMIISGKQSISVIIERAKILDLNIISGMYNIVLVMIEEDIIDNTHSQVIASVQDNIYKYMFNPEKFLMFNIGIDMYAFLVKGDESTIYINTMHCVDILNDICSPLQHRVYWKTAYGNPVYRLSMVAECYKDARRSLLYNARGMDYKGSSRIDFDINKLDADKMDSYLITKFLTNGVVDDITDFLDDYFIDLENGIKSLLFRQYVLLNIQFATSAFASKLSNNTQVILDLVDMKMEVAIQSIDGTRKYIEILLENAIRLRDSVVQDRYTDMLNKAIAYINQNYSDAQIGLKKVAGVVNVTPTHFSAIFSQNIGKTFIEYLTDIRMEKAREFLRCTNDGNRDIAMKVGYNDPHYFSFLFKKVNGCSPRDYRNRKVK